MDPVPVSKAAVLDKDGNPLDPQPPIAWSVQPPAVANLNGTQIVPVGSGEAKVTASVGEINSTYAYIVALPDTIEVAGYSVGKSVAVGQTAVLTAVVKAGDAMIEGQPVAWSSSDETVAVIDATGTVTGITPGKVRIKAASGPISAVVDIRVGGGGAQHVQRYLDPFIGCYGTAEGSLSFWEHIVTTAGDGGAQIKVDSSDGTVANGRVTWAPADDYLSKGAVTFMLSANGNRLTISQHGGDVRKLRKVSADPAACFAL